MLMLILSRQKESLVWSNLLGVARAVAVAGGEAHRVGEPHHGEERQEPGVPLPPRVPQGHRAAQYS